MPSQTSKPLNNLDQKNTGRQATFAAVNLGDNPSFNKDLKEEYATFSGIVVNDPNQIKFTLEYYKKVKTDNILLPQDFDPSSNNYVVVIYASAQKSSELLDKPENYLCLQPTDMKYKLYLTRLSQGIGGGKIIVDKTKFQPAVPVKGDIINIQAVISDHAYSSPIIRVESSASKLKCPEKPKVNPSSPPAAGAGSPSPDRPTPNVNLKIESAKTVGSGNQAAPASSPATTSNAAVNAQCSSKFYDAKKQKPPWASSNSPLNWWEDKPFLRAIKEMARDLDEDAESLLAILYLESGIRPWSRSCNKNNLIYAAGINQYTVPALFELAINPRTWLKKELTPKVPAITEGQRNTPKGKKKCEDLGASCSDLTQDGFKKISSVSREDAVQLFRASYCGVNNCSKKGKRSLGFFYCKNFLPGRCLPDKPDTVVTSKSDPKKYYEPNKGLDQNKDGFITISDLEIIMTRKLSELRSIVKKATNKTVQQLLQEVG